MSCFIFDVETMGIESTCVILSAAMTYVGDENNYTYDDLLKSSIFVKFDAHEQLNAGRTVTQSTVDWWKSLDKEIIRKSYKPSTEDISVNLGLSKLRDFYNENKKSKNDIVWIRGQLDSLAIDSLANSFNQEIIVPWWNYRDVRTAIDLLKATGKRGYCNIPNFDKSIVKKHDPIHDCVYDAMMLLYGE